MKKTLLFALFALMLPILSNAYDFVSGSIYYNIDYDGNSVSVTYATTSYKSYSGSVTIPTSVTYGGINYRVTSIGSSAFRNCDWLTSVTIPNSIISIGTDAFYQCKRLTSITIPNSVTSIGDAAFYGTAWYNSQSDGLIYAGNVAYKYKGTMPGGTNIEIKKGTSGISPFAFEKCYQLTSITIPNSVKSIGDHAFTGCTGLKSVTIPNSITSINDHVFDNCTELTSVTIPNSVTSIGHMAFWECLSLTSFTVPESVKSIGYDAFGRTAWYNNQADGLLYVGKIAYKYKGIMPGGTEITIKDGTLGIADQAFYECSGLKSITIPTSLTSIGFSAFRSCTGLTSVTIPNSVTEIGEHTFSYCSGLTSVTIPNSVTSIGSYAFSNCSGLTSVTIPKSVTSIGQYAFRACSGLTSVTIPNSVTSIEQSAFSGCSGLTSITIPNSVTSIGQDAFYGCSGLTSVTIPNSVTSISGSAFSGCSGLTSVTIGNSVTSIGSSAFSGCSKLKEVSCLAVQVPSTGSSCFSDVPQSTATLYVPASSVYSYMNAEQWKKFGTILAIGSVPATGISLNKTSATLTSKGQPLQLTATVTPSNATNKSVTWTSSNTSVATVSSTGLVTAVSSGTATITATTADGSNKTATCKVTVNISVPVTGISLNQTSATLTNKGQTLQLSATVTPSNASNKSVTWSSSNTAVATVSSTGLVTAVASGSATITATTADGSNITATCTIMVSIPNGIVIDGISYILNSTTQEATVTYTGIEGSHVSSYTGNINIPSTVTYNNVAYSVTSIGEYAFNECSSLTSVSIPESVTSIGPSAFSGCSGLTGLEIKQPENTDYEVISDISTYLDRSFMYVYDKTQNKWYALNNQNEYELYGVYGTDKSTGYEGKLVVVDEHEWEYSQGNWVDLGSIKTQKVNSIGKLTEGGKNYIDLGLHFSDKMRIQIKFCPVKAGGGAILNDWGKDDNTDWRFFFYGSTLYYDFDTSRLYTSKSLNKIYEWEIGNYYIKDIATNTNILKGTAHTNFSNRDNNMLINGGSGDLTRYYYVKIFEGETLIRDLEPYYDGAAYGLWDKITGQAYMPIGENWEGEMEEHEVWPKLYVVKESPIVVGLASIDDYAFDGCSGLTSITIPSSVTSIGEATFRNCNSLTSVTSYASQVPETSSLAFQNVSISSATLYVLESSVDSYKTTTPWSWFGTILPIPLAGDANGNGEVEIGDVTSVLTLMATPEATDYDNKAADANCNGEIEIGDVTTILTIMAKGE